jgi:hypothetical protein
MAAVGRHIVTARRRVRFPSGGTLLALLLAASACRSLILRTDDGGKTWGAVSSPTEIVSLQAVVTAAR